MTVKEIRYSFHFQKDIRKSPQEIIKRAIEKEAVFRKNPLHPSLRFHALKGALSGLWSISVLGACRMLFYREEDGAIVFFSIGKHDIYKSL